MGQVFQLTGSAIEGYGPKLLATTPGLSPALRQALSVDASKLPTQVCFGRIRPDPDEFPRHLSFSRYVNLGAAPPPVVVDYSAKAMSSLNRILRNDVKGCCVISAKGHSLGVWSANDNQPIIIPTDAEIDAAYARLAYVPGTDSGCVIKDVLSKFRTEGIQFGGAIRKIDGYVTVNWTDKTLWQMATYLLGSLSVGFLVPQAWLNSSVWDDTNSAIAGGHCVTPIGYNADGVLVSSWGRLYLWLWRSFLSRRYMDEAYAMLSPNWYNSDKLSPAGFDVTKLQADLAKIGNGTVPTIDPVTPPPPPTTSWKVAVPGACTITGTGTKPTIQ